MVQGSEPLFEWLCLADMPDGKVQQDHGHVVFPHLPVHAASAKTPEVEVRSTYLLHCQLFRPLSAFQAT